MRERSSTRQKALDNALDKAENLPEAEQSKSAGVRRESCLQFVPISRGSVASSAGFSPRPPASWRQRRALWQALPRGGLTEISSMKRGPPGILIAGDVATLPMPAGLVPCFKLSSS